MKYLNRFFLMILFLSAAACENPMKKAVRNVTYSAYEAVGVEKRDLLKKRVDSARDEQKEASEDFQDALTRLKSVYGFEGGDLEKKYESLKDSYEEADAQANEVKRSIDKVETVATDLFKEWEKEIQQMETASLRSRSRKTLLETQDRYEDLATRLKASEKRMDPVLKKFKDQVLYLKHNLNARAIASLKGEALSIENEIEGLIREMSKSIESADQFIKELE